MGWWSRTFAAASRVTSVVTIERVIESLAAASLLAACGEAARPLTEDQICRSRNADYDGDWFYSAADSEPFALTVWNEALYFYTDAGKARLQRYDHGAWGPVTRAPKGYRDVAGPPISWLGDLYTFEFSFEDSGLWRIAPDDSRTWAANAAWSSNGVPWAAVYSDALYFQALVPSGDTELLRFDGATAAVAADIASDDSPGGLPGSFPIHLTALGDTLYFLALDATNKRVLWAYDGLSASLERDFAPDSPYGASAILGTRDDSLVLLTTLEGMNFGALVSYVPGAEPVVVDTAVDSAVLAGQTIVYTKGGEGYRYDGVAPVAVGTLGRMVTGGVEIGSRLYVIVSNDWVSYGDLFEIHADSATNLLVGSDIVAVTEIAAFEGMLFVSAVDRGGGKFLSVHPEFFGHELFRFDPESATFELAADVSPGWWLGCPSVP